MKIITINDIAAVNLDFRDLFVPGFTDKYQRSARAEYNFTCKYNFVAYD